MRSASMLLYTVSVGSGAKPFANFGERGYSSSPSVDTFVQDNLLRVWRFTDVSDTVASAQLKGDTAS